jgi:hypothetical protein
MLLGLLTVIGFQTFNSVSVPITEIDAKINTTRRQELVEVTYIRKFSIDKDFIGTVHREAIHLDSENRYEFPGFHRNFKTGEYVRTRTLMLPAGAPNGRYVLRTYVIWKPTFSLREHFTEIPDVSFKICDKYEICSGETK